MVTLSLIETGASIDPVSLGWLDRPMPLDAFSQWHAQPASRCYHAVHDGRCVALVLVADVAGDWEIIDWGVDPDRRGRGVGTSVLHELINLCRHSGGGSVVLDVRESNAPALAIYDKLGFDVVGRRKGYYHTGDDSLTMKVVVHAA